MDALDERRYVVRVSRVMFGGRLFSKGDVIQQPNFGAFNALVRSGALVPLPSGIESETSEGEWVETPVSQAVILRINSA